ncbi:ATP-binding protein [Alphaproteobacteria bacterium]|jgi:two-component system osmolarity sensor histidine kinase EnvZ|nr:ATP-binding protein [Alphaproteobacteria bacterium]MDB2684339.1 ATP-binding protein [Alphaproteobacteria bacterium]MDC1035608.1 ATP-binding protein [Alphaproteobacteria bacterium]
MRLRDITPKSLFGRMLAIILVPIILVQIISVSIFYERHWDWVSRHMSKNLAKDLGLLIDELGNEPSKDQRALSAIRARQYFDIIFYWLEGGILQPNQIIEPQFKNFRNSLQARIKEPFYLSTIENSRQFYVDIQLGNGIVRMNIDNKRLFVPTGITFIMWSIGASVILFSIAIIFLRGQVRPILRLANAARQIGFGRDVDSFSIEGATEIRIAGRAFQAMRHRINKQISERTSLLAGVSHDLKTPLTRMRLQLAVIEIEDDAKIEFEKELLELEEMIDGYLEFARDDREEQMVDASLFKLLQQASITSDPSGDKINILPPNDNIPIFPIQVQSIRRALTNLLTNAIRYAGKATAQIQIFDDHSEIIIDDNGPGIPRDKRAEVILPFTRLENSRNSKTGGTGLGLSIAKNSALNHGGELILEDSPLGGLRVRLLLPL